MALPLIVVATDLGAPPAPNETWEQTYDRISKLPRWSSFTLLPKERLKFLESKGFNIKFTQERSYRTEVIANRDGIRMIMRFQYESITVLTRCEDGLFRKSKFCHGYFRWADIAKVDEIPFIPKDKTKQQTKADLPKPLEFKEPTYRLTEKGVAFNSLFRRNVRVLDVVAINKDLSLSKNIFRPGEEVWFHIEGDNYLQIVTDGEKYYPLKTKGVRKISFRDDQITDPRLKELAIGDGELVRMAIAQYKQSLTGVTENGKTE